MTQKFATQAIVSDEARVDKTPEFWEQHVRDEFMENARSQGVEFTPEDITLKWVSPEERLMETLNNQLQEPAPGYWELRLSARPQ